jgi:hypothetical protein
MNGSTSFGLMFRGDLMRAAKFSGARRSAQNPQNWRKS